MTKKDLDPASHYAKVGKLLESLCTMLNEDQKVTYWEIICSKLRSIALKKEGSSGATSVSTPTTAKIKAFMASVGKKTDDAMIMIATLNRLTHLLGIEFIDKYPKPSAFIEIIERYLTTSSNCLQLQCSKTIGNLVNLFPKWRAQLLSKFINQLQIARADLNILTSATDAQEIDEFNYKFYCLKGNILAAVELSKNIDFDHISIPFDLANSIFEAGKSKLIYLRSISNDNRSDS